MLLSGTRIPQFQHLLRDSAHFWQPCRSVRCEYHFLSVQVCLWVGTGRFRGLEGRQCFKTQQWGLTRRLGHDGWYWAAVSATPCITLLVVARHPERSFCSCPSLSRGTEWLRPCSLTSVESFALKPWRGGGELFVVVWEIYRTLLKNGSCLVFHFFSSSSFHKRHIEYDELRVCFFLLVIIRTTVHQVLCGPVLSLFFPGGWTWISIKNFCPSGVAQFAHGTFVVSFFMFTSLTA